MVGPRGGYYANAFIFIMTKKDEERDSENAIRLENVFNTSFTATAEGTEEANDSVWEYNGEFQAKISEPMEFTATGRIVNFNEDMRAQFLGFKNANCMGRYIRRMKRKKEQERRRMLKNGKGRNNESH